MQRSLAALKKPELNIVYSLHPDACSIVKVNIWRWSVECAGVPLHFYRDTVQCETHQPNLPTDCRLAASVEEDCRSFFWDIDLDGKPFDPISHRSSNYASISEECRPKGTLTSEREEMARRGMRPVRVEICGNVKKVFNERR